MANISAITSASETVTVFVDSTAGFNIGSLATFAGLTLSGALAALLNGTTRTVNVVGGGTLQFNVPGAPNFPTGSSSDAETGTLTVLSTLTTVFLKFEDPAGVPIAKGSVDIWLTFDASTSGTSNVQVTAGRKVSIPLDANGTCLVTLYANNLLKPSTNQYRARAFTALGQPCWNGILTVSSGSGGFLLQEDGASGFLLEDGTGLILLES